MPFRPSLATAALLAVVTVGGCTCFEQKRTGPLPAPPPAVEEEPAPRARYEPTPLDPPPPPAPAPVPVEATAAAPVEVAIEPEPTPEKVPEPGLAPTVPRIERVGGKPLNTRKAIESLRTVSPSRRAELLRGPLVFPKKLQPLAPTKPAPDPDAPRAEPLPVE